MEVLLYGDGRRMVELSMSDADRQLDPGKTAASLAVVQRMLARERLAIDEAEPGRTSFLSHVGAQTKLVPGPWIGHRDLIYALALANLNPAQRTSLARAVLIEHGREFGVGRLRLVSLASGLPLGGSSLMLQQRSGGPTVVHTWALGVSPQPVKCDWLVLRAQPEWALDEPPPPLSTQGLQLLSELGGEVVVLVASAVAAVQIASACAGKVACAAHPRYAPYIEGHTPDARVLLWPHDALDGAGLRRHEVVAIALVGAPESVRIDLDGWLARRGPRAEPIPVRAAACPGRAGRADVQRFWEACGRPRVLLTGDPGWTPAASRWLSSIHATVVVHGEATQLELL